MSAFFSSAETAITSLNVIRLNEISKTKNNQYSKRAKLVFKLVKNYNLTLTAILISNTVINLAIGTLSTILFVDSFKLGKYAPLFATLISAVIVLVLGEIIPKNIAKVYPEKTMLWYSYILTIFTFIFYPLIFLFSLIRVKTKLPTSSEQELIELVKIIEHEGVLESAERRLIVSAINFDEKSVFMAMQPKIKITYIYENSSEEIIKKIYLEEKHTRIPVVDSYTNEVVGILNLSDYWVSILQKKPIDIKKLMNEPIFISKRAKLNYALELMQKERTHIAIVCNNKEKKDFAGIITLEDVLEEIVGEIYDENDQVGLVQEVGHHKFLVKGNCDVNYLFTNYLNYHSPTNKNINLLNWYKKKMKLTRVSKKSMPLWTKNFVFTIVKNDVKKKEIVFEIEVLTKQKNLK